MSNWRSIILTEHFERTAHKRAVCVYKEKERKKGGGRQRAPGWGGKNDFSQSVTVHTYTQTWKYISDIPVLK